MADEETDKKARRTIDQVYRGVLEHEEICFVTVPFERKDNPIEDDLSWFIAHTELLGSRVLPPRLRRLDQTLRKMGVYGLPVPKSVEPEEE